MESFDIIELLVTGPLIAKIDLTGSKRPAIRSRIISPLNTKHFKLSISFSVQIVYKDGTIYEFY